jgi:hypothetical protein
MRSLKEIEDRLIMLKSDERLQGPPAQVQINPPLALVQTDLEASIHALEWVLKKDFSRFPRFPLKKKRHEETLDEALA